MPDRPWTLADLEAEEKAPATTRPPSPRTAAPRQKKVWTLADVEGPSTPTDPSVTPGIADFRRYEDSARPVTGGMADVRRMDDRPPIYATPGEGSQGVDQNYREPGATSREAARRLSQMQAPPAPLIPPMDARGLAPSGPLQQPGPGPVLSEHTRSMMNQPAPLPPSLETSRAIGQRGLAVPQIMQERPIDPDLIGVETSPGLMRTPLMSSDQIRGYIQSTPMLNQYAQYMDTPAGRAAVDFISQQTTPEQIALMFTGFGPMKKQELLQEIAKRAFQGMMLHGTYQAAERTAEAYGGAQAPGPGAQPFQEEFEYGLVETGLSAGMAALPTKHDVADTLRYERGRNAPGLPFEPRPYTPPAEFQRTDPYSDFARGPGGLQNWPRPGQMPVERMPVDVPPPPPAAPPPPPEGPFGRDREIVDEFGRAVEQMPREQPPAPPEGPSAQERLRFALAERERRRGWEPEGRPVSPVFEGEAAPEGPPAPPRPMGIEDLTLEEPPPPPAPPPGPPPPPPLVKLKGRPVPGMERVDEFINAPVEELQGQMQPPEQAPEQVPQETASTRLRRAMAERRAAEAAAPPPAPREAPQARPESPELAKLRQRLAATKIPALRQALEQRIAAMEAEAPKAQAPTTMGGEMAEALTGSLEQIRSEISNVDYGQGDADNTFEFTFRGKDYEAPLGDVVLDFDKPEALQALAAEALINKTAKEIEYEGEGAPDEGRFTRPSPAELKKMNEEYEAESQKRGAPAWDKDPTGRAVWDTIGRGSEHNWMRRDIDELAKTGATDEVLMAELGRIYGIYGGHSVPGGFVDHYGGKNPRVVWKPGWAMEGREAGKEVTIKGKKLLAEVRRLFNIGEPDAPTRQQQVARMEEVRAAEARKKQDDAERAAENEKWAEKETVEEVFGEGVNYDASFRNKKTGELYKELDDVPLEVELRDTEIGTITDGKFTADESQFTPRVEEKKEPKPKSAAQERLAKGLEEKKKGKSVEQLKNAREAAQRRLKGLENKLTVVEGEGKAETPQAEKLRTAIEAAEKDLYEKGQAWREAMGQPAEAGQPAKAPARYQAELDQHGGRWWILDTRVGATINGRENSFASAKEARARAKQMNEKAAAGPPPPPLPDFKQGNRVRPFRDPDDYGVGTVIGLRPVHGSEWVDVKFENEKHPVSYPKDQLEIVGEAKAEAPKTEAQARLAKGLAEKKAPKDQFEELSGFKKGDKVKVDDKEAPDVGTIKYIFRDKEGREGAVVSYMGKDVGSLKGVEWTITADLRQMKRIEAGAAPEVPSFLGGKPPAPGKTIQQERMAKAVAEHPEDRFVVERDEKTYVVYDKERDKVVEIHKNVGAAEAAARRLNQTPEVSPKSAAQARLAKAREAKEAAARAARGQPTPDELAKMKQREAAQEIADLRQKVILLREGRMRPGMGEKVSEVIEELEGRIARLKGGEPEGKAVTWTGETMEPTDPYVQRQQEPDPLAEAKEAQRQAAAAKKREANRKAIAEYTAEQEKPKEAARAKAREELEAEEKKQAAKVEAEKEAKIRKEAEAEVRKSPTVVDVTKLTEQAQREITDLRHKLDEILGGKEITPATPQWTKDSAYRIQERIRNIEESVRKGTYGRTYWEQHYKVNNDPKALYAHVEWAAGRDLLDPHREAEIREEYQKHIASNKLAEIDRALRSLVEVEIEVRHKYGEEAAKPFKALYEKAKQHIADLKEFGLEARKKAEAREKAEKKEKAAQKAKDVEGAATVLAEHMASRRTARERAELLDPRNPDVPEDVRAAAEAVRNSETQPVFGLPEDFSPKDLGTPFRYTKTELKAHRWEHEGETWHTNGHFMSKGVPKDIAEARDPISPETVNDLLGRQAEPAEIAGFVLRKPETGRVRGESTVTKWDSAVVVQGENARVVIEPNYLARMMKDHPGAKLLIEVPGVDLGQYKGALKGRSRPQTKPGDSMVYLEKDGKRVAVVMPLRMDFAPYGSTIPMPKGAKRGGVLSDSLRGGARQRLSEAFEHTPDPGQLELIRGTEAPTVETMRPSEREPHEGEGPPIVKQQPPGEKKPSGEEIDREASEAESERILAQEDKTEKYVANVTGHTTYWHERREPDVDSLSKPKGRPPNIQLERAAPISTRGAMGAARELKRDIQQALSIGSFSDTAKVAAGGIRQAEARTRTMFAIAEHSLQKARRALWMPKEDITNFIDAVETGPEAIEKLPAEQQEYAKVMRDLLDEARKEVQGLGPGFLPNFIQHYYPHIWKDKTQAELWMGRRPLEGRSGFLRQRKFPTFKEGLKAGLEPVSWNPVDAVLQRVVEMKRFTEVHKAIREMKDYGLMKRFDARMPTSQLPAGYSWLHDKFGQIWAKEGVSVPIGESMDAKLLGQLEQVAKSLGITHERKAGVGGTFGYSVVGKPYIRTRLGTKMGTLVHEIGHQLDAKFKLWDRLHETTKEKGKVAGALRERAAIGKELRALADLRLQKEKINVAGETLEPSGKRQAEYVRSQPEKVAHLLDVYVTNRNIMAEKAPTVLKKLEAILDAEPALRPLRNMQESPYGTRGEFVTNVPVNIKGKVLEERIAVPTEVAKLFENYLSPGLQGKKWFRAIRVAGNSLVQFRLGWSAFHAAVTGIEESVNQVSLAARMAAQAAKKGGDRRFGRAIMTAVKSPVASFTLLRQGAKIRKGIRERNPAYDAIRKELEAAGGSIQMGSHYATGLARGWRDSIDRVVGGTSKGWGAVGHIVKALATTPWALTDYASRPIMEHWVPNLKVGAFARLAHFELERLGPEAHPTEIRQALGKTWDSVENRLGQLTYENLFWNKTLKDLSMASVTSLGWNLGTIREIGGGVMDVAGMYGRSKKQETIQMKRADAMKDARAEAALTGEDVKIPRYIPDLNDPVFTSRMSYVMALPVTVGIIGATMQYAMTGEGPKEFKDYYFPRTGRKNADGTDERITLPTYMRDVFAYAKQPLKTVEHKLNPAITAFLELLVENKDFYGVEIVGGHEDADNEFVRAFEKGKDVVKYLTGMHKPIAVSNIEKVEAEGGTTLGKAAGFLGLQEAPKYITATDAGRAMAKHYAGVSGTEPRTKAQGERREVLKEAEKLERQGRTDEAQKILEDAADRGLLNEADFKAYGTKLQGEPSGNRFKGLPTEKKLEVYQLGTDEEKEAWRPILDEAMKDFWKNDYKKKRPMEIESIRRRMEPIYGKE